MTKEKIEKLIKSTEVDVEIAKNISDDFVNQYTSTLDDIMRDINKDIISSVGVPDSTLEQYFLELTNAYYFIASKCESFGLYEDVAKLNAKIKYNEAYGDSQLSATANAKKATVAELVINAEQASLDENVIAYIYARSFKIIKTKLEAAETMISTLSKIISSHMSENAINSSKVANTTM